MSEKTGEEGERKRHCWKKKQNRKPYPLRQLYPDLTHVGSSSEDKYLSGDSHRSSECSVAASLRRLRLDSRDSNKGKKNESKQTPTEPNALSAKADAPHYKTPDMGPCCQGCPPPSAPLPYAEDIRPTGGMSFCPRVWREVGTFSPSSYAAAFPVFQDNQGNGR